MVDIESICKLSFVQRWSIRKISRELGYSRQSVRKAIASSAPPRCHLREPRPRPVVGPYLGVIEQWLRDDAQAPRKQRHTARRIYGGRRTEVQLFCLQLHVSGVAFVRAYPTQRLKAFLDGHCRAFADQVRQAVEQAMAMDMLELATVRQLLLNQTAPAAPGPVPVPLAFRDVQLAVADLARSNALLEGMRTA